MGKRDENKKKKNELRDSFQQLAVVEFGVSMYCNACERTVAKTISRLEGVEKFVTDMTKHKVVVTGKIDPEKVLKKLRKKTGRRVEIVVSDASDGVKNEALEGGDGPEEEEEDCRGSEWAFDEWRDALILTMFSDENPNACLIM